ncbi:uncharacterized protein LOC123310194 [Coccinella septempunctata]|uniref:uncharacterized protein LOC123310194 n=1 Tax=Coccinella septempunctata TaxID=41139 RepID=UPI001D076D3D|nr:uncharacterized protein LOC123310194 [Coccinella septempunctata]
MNSKLRPEAPIYLPPTRETAIFTRSCDTSPSSLKQKEPQCSRYSRRSVRHTYSNPNSPRPILGTKMSHLRAILGRKEENVPTMENEQNDEVPAATQAENEMNISVD